jgi:hypothetical protein
VSVLPDQSHCACFSEGQIVKGQFCWPAQIACAPLKNMPPKQLQTNGFALYTRDEIKPRLEQERNRSVPMEVAIRVAGACWEV